MPIYEFYCARCHMIFNFFSRSINTDRDPMCPRCREQKLKRQMSLFSVSRNREEHEETPMPDLDEGKMESVVNALAHEAEHLNEDDPRQAANLMRKLTDMTGMNLSKTMEEALSRMEAGEDPDKIEEEMGDLLENEDPFGMKPKGSWKSDYRPPAVDDTLYELD